MTTDLYRCGKCGMVYGALRHARGCECSRIKQQMMERQHAISWHVRAPHFANGPVHVDHAESLHAGGGGTGVQVSGGCGGSTPIPASEGTAEMPTKVVTPPVSTVAPVPRTDWKDLCAIVMEAVDAGLAIVFHEHADGGWSVAGKLHGSLGNKALHGHELGTCSPAERGDLEALIEKRRAANAAKRTMPFADRGSVGVLARSVALLRADLLHMTPAGIEEKLAQIDAVLKEQIR